MVIQSIGTIRRAYFEVLLLLLLLLGAGAHGL